MTFSLTRPSDRRLESILRRVADHPYTYADVGASRSGDPPAGYPVNQRRERIGEGRADFEAARAAANRWAMYEIPWTRLCWPTAPAEAGSVAGTLVFHLGFWSFNPVRVVYRFEETDGVERSGFAIGTLPGHAEAGEERFTVEYDPAEDAVWFEVYSFARADHWLVRAGFPFMRLLQRRFAREAMHAMRRAIRGGLR